MNSYNDRVVARESCNLTVQRLPGIALIGRREAVRIGVDPFGILLGESAIVPNISHPAEVRIYGYKYASLLGHGRGRVEQL